MNSQSPQKTAKGYHHGDLRSALLEKAEQMLAEQGITGLTLRGLAERAGVSRQAPYHHFASKQALLFALAEQSFSDLDAVLRESMQDSEQPLSQRLQRYVVSYVRYAIAKPEQYELMFGQVTWKNNPSASLIKKGHASFRRYAEMIRDLQDSGALSPDLDALRLAQTTWATLHGLCRLKNDGIFASSDSVEEISLYAVNMMMATLGQVSD